MALKLLGKFLTLWKRKAATGPKRRNRKSDSKETKKILLPLLKSD